MKQVLELLYFRLGSPSRVAHFLQYSDRHLRNIRQKVERGEPLDPRVEFWIKTRSALLDNDFPLNTTGK